MRYRSLSICVNDRVIWGTMGSLPSWRQVTNKTTASSKRTWETYQRDSWSIESNKALEDTIRTVTLRRERKTHRRVIVMKEKRLMTKFKTAAVR